MRAAADPRVEELLDRWDDLRAEGRNPSAADLTQDPELLPRLEAAIAEIASLEEQLGGAPLAPAAPARGVPGRFESLAMHAEGGMGIVYRAWDAELGRAVAYKVIKPSLSADRRAVAKFLTEAQLTARMQHPGVVPVHGMTSDSDGRPMRCGSSRGCRSSRPSKRSTPRTPKCPGRARPGKGC
jgi:hypothetical protein